MIGKAADTVKALTDVVLVGNDIFAADECCSSSSSSLSKRALLWFCK
jgi:hypothetical protein